MPSRLTPEEAVPLLAQHGIYSEARDGHHYITTGSKSGNLACLCASSTLSMDVLEIIKGAACFVDPRGNEQYFYRCTQSEKTRKLTAAVTIHGESDEVDCYPSPGFEKANGSLTSIPTLTWLDHCRLVDILMVDAPIVAPLPDVTDSNIGSFLGMMTLTERNAALAFEKLYGDRFRYCKTWGQWLEWVESRWASEHTDLAFDCIVRIVSECNVQMKTSPAKASFSAGAERIARAARGFATRSHDWDRDAWLLNSPVGTYDLRTGVTRPHDKADHITKCTAVAPKPGPLPEFNKFLNTITLGDESLQDYHQRSLGACLSGAMSDNFLLFWHGTGQNGKNTFGELIRWVMGDYAQTIPTETLMASKSSGHLTELANLRGLRLAISSEVSEGCYWDEQRVKSLTGDREISARFMHKDLFVYERTHKHLVFGNNRPMLRIVDPAMKTRLHLVPFKMHFEPDMKDPQMASKLRAEAPGILQWLIDGHSKWLEDGYLKKCSIVQAETDAYFEAQSTPDMWISECCVLDDAAYGSAGDLYKSFKAWKEARGEGALSQTRWGEWMSVRFTKVRSNGMKYRGVDLKPSSVLDF
jgi:putative DNA primase/helicase